MNPGQEALAAIDSILARFPDARLQVERRETSIIVTPTGPGTFAISIYDEGDNAMIAADRWHAHYEDPQEAAWCVYWLLTPFMRIVHELRTGVLAAAWVERFEAEGWEPMDPVYFLNPEDEPSWRTTPTQTWARRVWQQNVLPVLRPYDQTCPGAVLDDAGFPEETQIGPVLIPTDSAIGHTLLED